MEIDHIIDAQDKLKILIDDECKRILRKHFDNRNMLFSLLVDGNIVDEIMKNKKITNAIGDFLRTYNGRSIETQGLCMFVTRKYREALSIRGNIYFRYLCK